MEKRVMARFRRERVFHSKRRDHYSHLLLLFSRREFLSQDWLEHALDIFRHGALTGRIRVHEVRLVQFGIAADSFEEIGDQRGFGSFFRQRGERVAESAHVIIARITGKLHA